MRAAAGSAEGGSRFFFGALLRVVRSGAVVRRIPDAALLKHSGATAEFVSSLTWTFLTMRSRAGGSIRCFAGDRIDPRHASGRLRAARCWSSPRVAYPTNQTVIAGGGRRRHPRRRPAAVLIGFGADCRNPSNGGLVKGRLRKWYGADPVSKNDLEFWSCVRVGERRIACGPSPAMAVEVEVSLRRAFGGGEPWQRSASREAFARGHGGGGFHGGGFHGGGSPVACSSRPAAATPGQPVHMGRNRRDAHRPLRIKIDNRRGPHRA
jgi:hypothetical protein